MLENCLEFGRRWSCQTQQFQRLVILINKWEKLDEFHPGVDGGSRYMRETFGVSPESILQSSSSLSPEAMRVIKQMSDWDCFLFPERNVDTTDTYKQNLESFLALVLGRKQQGKVIQGKVACGEDICGLLHDLPKLADLLNKEIPPPPEVVEDDGAAAAAASKNYVDQASSIQVYPRMDYAIQESSEFSHDFSDDEEDDDDHVDPTSLTLPTEEIIKDAEKYWNDNAKDLFSDLSSNNNDDFEFDFIPKTTVPSTEPETEKGGQSNIQESTPSVSMDSPRPEIAPLPATLSADDIINQIFQPIPKPARPVSYISGLKLINDKVSQGVNKLTFSESLPEQTGTASIAEQKSTSSSLIDKPEDKSDSSQFYQNLLTTACKTFDELHINSNNYEFSTIWQHVVEIAGGHMSTANNSNNNVSNALLTSIQIVNNYLTRIDEVMQSNVCFPREDQLVEISKSIKEQILIPSSNANDALNKMRPFLLKKLQNAETTFVRLNKDIYSAEKRTAEFCIGHIFEFYTAQIESNSPQRGESLSEFQNRHKNLVNYCTQAFNHSYGETNPELNSIFLKNLESKLNSDYDSRESKYRQNQMQEKQLGASLVQKFHAKYNSDIDFQYKNPAMNASNFDTVHKTVSDKVFFDFKKEAEKLSPDGQLKFLKKLENEVITSKNRLQEKFEKHKPAPISRFLQANETPSNSTTPQETTVTPTYAQKAAGYTQQTPISSDLIPVGVYFGLDLLSAVALINGKFRQVYGPAANVISLGKEIFIGNSYKSDTSKVVKSRSFRDMFDQVDIAKKTYGVHKYDDIQLRFRLDGIVALILSQLHQHATAELLSDKLKFVITIPSSSNSTMWNVFTNAITISRINATIVRESCCLLTNKIHEKIIPQKASHILVLLEDELKQTCDMVWYMKCNESWFIQLVAGYWPTATIVDKLFSRTSLGIQEAIQQIPEHIQPPISEVLHHSTGKSTDSVQTTLQRIKDKFPKLTSNCAIFAKFNDIVNGACLLAAYDCIPSFRDGWKEKHSSLTDILNPKSSHPNKINCHKSLIPHTGNPLPPDSFGIYSIKIREILSDLLKELAIAKDEVQKQYLILLEKVSDKSRDQLDQAMRDIHNEHLSARKVRDMFKVSLDNLMDTS